MEATAEATTGPAARIPSVYHPPMFCRPRPVKIGILGKRRPVTAGPYSFLKG
jgi:hypothetical protein